MGRKNLILSFVILSLFVSLSSAFCIDFIGTCFLEPGKGIISPYIPSPPVLALPVKQPPVPAVETPKCSDSAYGKYHWASGDVCMDDCADLSPNYVCDVQTCKCVKFDVKTVGNCSANIVNAVEKIMGYPASMPEWKPGMYCQDGCQSNSNDIKRFESQVSPDIWAQIKQYADYTSCNPTTCKCKKPSQPPAEATCSGGQWKDGMVCKDDCAQAMGADYTCNIKTCACEKTGPGTPACSDAKYGAYHWKPGMACKDDCAEYSIKIAQPGTPVPDYKCDAATCMCKENVKCSIGVGKEVDVCVDDCAQAMGENYACNATSCKCEKKPVDKCMVSVQTDPKNLFQTKQVCGGTCANPKHMCQFIQSTGIVPPGGITGIGDCKCACPQKSCAPGYIFNETTCDCEVEPAFEANCSAEIYNAEFDLLGSHTPHFPVWRSGQVCKDNCQATSDELKGYESTVPPDKLDEYKKLEGLIYCNAQTCKCEEKPKPPAEASCAKGDWQNGMICKNDCPGQGFSEKYQNFFYQICNATACQCVPQVGCYNNSAGLDGPWQAGMMCLDDCKKQLSAAYSCDAGCRCVKTGTTGTNPPPAVNPTKPATPPANTVPTSPPQKGSFKYWYQVG